MCECGCSMNNEAYVLPGPKGSVYLVTFQPECTNCDGPPAVIIERFESRKALKEYAFELPPTLPLEKWPESHGVAIVTGYTKDEFVKALRGNLVGLKPNDFVDKPGEGFGKEAADVILEEMYDDSQVTPQLPSLSRTKR